MISARIHSLHKDNLHRDNIMTTKITTTTIRTLVTTTTMTTTTIETIPTTITASCPGCVAPYNSNKKLVITVWG